MFKLSNLFSIAAVFFFAGISAQNFPFSTPKPLRIVAVLPPQLAASVQQPVSQGATTSVAYININQSNGQPSITSTAPLSQQTQLLQIAQKNPQAVGQSFFVFQNGEAVQMAKPEQFSIIAASMNGNKPVPSLTFPYSTQILVRNSNSWQTTDNQPIAFDASQLEQTMSQSGFLNSEQGYFLVLYSTQNGQNTIIQMIKMEISPQQSSSIVYTPYPQTFA